MSGVQITETVDKLMALAGKPRDTLTTRNTDLKNEQTALTTLTALLTTFGYVTDNLGKTDLYGKQTATSSNSTALTGTVTGSPTSGTYLFTPVRAAQSQQLLSSGFQSQTALVGAGKLTLRFGPGVDEGVNLSILNGGQGIVRGKMRITDGSGASAEIDLSAAQTVDDVLDAINNNTTINVTAVAGKDGFVLTDNTGQSTSHLKVQEVSGGTTAASLGLAGIDTSNATANGSAVLKLAANVKLDDLNNGAGVEFHSSSIGDIDYTLHDGTSNSIDLSSLASKSGTATLGDVVDLINEAAPTSLKAEISSDGTHLVVTDLTSGSETFALTSAFGSRTVEDLGLTATESGGVITGTRILGGLKSVLLSRLDGGQGLGTLGTLDLTDRSGATATVDLSQAQTLQDVVETINAARKSATNPTGVSITASLNSARNGILLTDTTGATSHDLVVANGSDGLTTADKLKIAVSGAQTSINSGDLHPQVISYNTKLSGLNGGAGVASGSFTITDSTGKTANIDLTSSTIQTVGDVIQAINNTSLRVFADINDTGDGIVIRDLDHGTGTLSVSEGSSTTAADLGLARSATTVTIDNVATQVIDGTTTQTIDVTATDTLTSLLEKVNDLNAGVQAAVFNDGSSNPYRMMMVSQLPGKNGRLVVDTSQLSFTVQETTHAQDALLVVGDANSSSSGVLVSSSNNKFTDVVPGVTLTVKQASSQAVAIYIATSTTNIASNIQTMVDDYNSFREELNSDTAYDSTNDTSNVLTGDSTARRLDIDLSNLLSSRFNGVGSIKSLAELGITVDGEDGTLTLDTSKLQTVLDADPDAVKQFFTDKTNGMAAKFHNMVDQLSGSADTSLLTSRLQALSDQISSNQDRIDFLNERLAAQETALYTQFYNMDIAIGKLKNNLAVVEGITGLTPYTGNSDSSG